MFIKVGSYEKSYINIGFVVTEMSPGFSFKKNLRTHFSPPWIVLVFPN